MKIYPKTNEYLEGVQELEKYILQEKGIEIQYLEQSKEKIGNFNIENPISKLCQRYPELEEIIVHPPIGSYDIECILFRNEDLFISQLKTLIELSDKYNINISIIEHTKWRIQEHIKTTIPVLQEIIKLLKNTRVTMLFENMVLIEEIDKCTALEIAEFLENKNVGVCLDLCHINCQANVYKMPVEEYIKRYLDKEKCQKYIRKIHFASTKNNDGYVDKKTHGRVHDNKEKLIKDVELLCEYGTYNVPWVVEVSEEEYNLREDQIQEIKWLIEYREEKEGKNNE